jgi:hypothetical protein
MRIIFCALIATVIFGAVTNALAQTEERVTLRMSRQKTVTKDKLTIEFASLVDDSRCPQGTTCVWAGNAKIQVKVKSRNGTSRTFEMNTNMGPKGDQFGGYAINLVSLTPLPRANVNVDAKDYTATFTITRLRR